MQTNKLYILLWVFILTLVGNNIYAQNKPSKATTVLKDSIPKSNNEVIKAVIKHTAEDYILENVKKKDGKAL